MYLSTNSLDVDPGEGWRLLKPHELVEEGDEFRRYTTWTPSENWKSETRKQDSSAGPYRRRLTADGRAASKDDYLNAASTCIECQ